jgi:hypothetical protein
LLATTMCTSRLVRRCDPLEIDHSNGYLAINRLV